MEQSDTSKQPEIAIREARIDEIIGLRWRILREGLPREMADFPGDAEPTARHFGAFDASGEVVGCATFIRRPWQGMPAWQLRGMAIRDDLRGAGIGTHMLEIAEHVLAREGYSDQLWCNARTPATKFYERLGWQKFGEEFVVETAGPHFKMSKRLSTM